MTRFLRQQKRRQRREHARARQMYLEHNGRYSMRHCLEAMRGKR